MQRDTKLGYGFLLVGLGVAYLLSLLFGRLLGLTIAIVCVVVGVCFLVSGHRQSGKVVEDWHSVINVLVPSLELGIALAGITFIAWVIFSLSPDALKIPSLGDKYHPPKGPTIVKAPEENQPGVPETKPQQPVAPVIQIAPSFGNLQKRTLYLADKIDGLVKHRFDQKTKYPNPPTPESLTEWNRSNDVEFRSDCWDKVKSIHEEFAILHIRDEQLDGIVLKYEKSLQRRNSEPQTQWWSTYMNIFDMQSIAQRLRIMAGQLPQ